VKTLLPLLLLAAFFIAPNQHAVAQKIEEPALQEELLAMLDEAQADSTAAAAHQDSLEAVHGQRLVGIVEEYGWPTQKLVGLEGASAAYILFHENVSLRAQKQLLPVVQSHFRQKGSVRVVALLADEVRVREGKPQLYGTQVCQSEKGVQLVTAVDTAAANARRKEIGMESLEEYLRGINRLCPCPSLEKCI
jgi:hypothetical protein